MARAPLPHLGGELDHPGQRIAIRMRPHTPYSRLNAANDADADSNWHGKLNHGWQMENDVRFRMNASATTAFHAAAGSPVPATPNPNRR